MKDADKPLWYDVYAAFPPPVKSGASPDEKVTTIFYPEDRVRAFGPFGTVNLLNTSTEYKSLSQEFVVKHQEIAEQKTSLTSDEVFEETVAIMRAKGMLPSGGRSERRAAESRSEAGHSPEDTADGNKTSNFDLSKIMGS